MRIILGAIAILATVTAIGMSKPNDYVPIPDAQSAVEPAPKIDTAKATCACGADCQCGANCECKNLPNPTTTPVAGGASPSPAMPADTGDLQYQDIVTTETYNERVCTNGVCYVVPRSRQVVRRVAVAAARLAAVPVRVAANAVRLASPGEFTVSGGSAGNYTSYVAAPVATVSYGSAGTTAMVSSSVVHSDGGYVMARRQPIRNIIRGIFGRR